MKISLDDCLSVDNMNYVVVTFNTENKSLLRFARYYDSYSAEMHVDREQKILDDPVFGDEPIYYLVIDIHRKKICYPKKHEFLFKII